MTRQRPSRFVASRENEGVAQVSLSLSLFESDREGARGESGRARLRGVERGEGGIFWWGELLHTSLQNTTQTGEIRRGEVWEGKRGRE